MFLHLLFTAIPHLQYTYIYCTLLILIWQFMIQNVSVSTLVVILYMNVNGVKMLKNDKITILRTYKLLNKN